MAAKTYVVLDDLEHDQNTLTVGDTVELSAAEADPLLKLKVIAEQKPNASKPSKES